MQTQETSQRSEVVDLALRKVTRLATLPEITGRILEMLEDAETTAAELESLVEADPVLSVRVLKVVNSTFYGMPASVKSIKRAVMILGLTSLKNIVLAASFSKLLRGCDVPAHFEPEGLWQHSTAVATAARLIAAHTGADAEELFLAGLLHDVGTVVQLQALRPQFVELVRACEDPGEAAYSELEHEIVGATHDELGLALCEQWNFPASIRAAVGLHHDPERADEKYRYIAQTVQIADWLAASIGVGYCPAAQADAPRMACNGIGLTDSMLQDVRDALPEAAAVAMQIYS